MPSIYSKRNKQIFYPPDAVLIDRTTPYGNPFVVDRDGTRDEVIERYREHLKSRPQLVKKIKRDLKGKHLLCWCAPERCHGEVIMEIANDIS